MRIKSDFQLAEIGDEFVIMPVRNEVNRFNGVIVLNEEAGYLVKHMFDEVTTDELIELLYAKYEVDFQTAHSDVCSFIQHLNEYSLLVQ